MPTLGLPRSPALEAWPRHGPAVILDLECTAWQGSLARNWCGANEWREIVQIGCLLVDAGDGFREIESFESLVRPLRNQQLSEYFIALTGIEQSELEANGRQLAAVVGDLAPMMSRAQAILFNGFDGEVIRENCALQNVELQWPLGRMFDLKPLLSGTLGRLPTDLVSSALPKIAGAEFFGRAHSALADCRAIAMALAAWRRTGIL